VLFCKGTLFFCLFVDFLTITAFLTEKSYFFFFKNQKNNSIFADRFAGAEQRFLSVHLFANQLKK
jgi:hypothetical protein